MTNPAELSDDSSRQAGALVRALLVELDRQGARPQDISAVGDSSQVMIFEAVNLNRLVAACIAAERGGGF